MVVSVHHSKCGAAGKAFAHGLEGNQLKPQPPKHILRLCPWARHFSSRSNVVGCFKEGIRQEIQTKNCQVTVGYDWLAVA